MSDSPIHDLPPASTVAGTDVVPIDQGLVTRKATMFQVSQFIGPINVENSIHVSPDKATPIDADEFGIVDTADGNRLKKLTWANLKATLAALTATWNISTTGNAAAATKLQTARNIDATSFDGTVNVTVVAPAIHAATNKTTPVDADEAGIWDNVSGLINKVTWANIKITLAGTFTTITSLAASGGAALVGFIQSGIGAIARTVQSKLQDTVSIFDFMSAAQIADVKAGTALLDVSAAVQTAVNTTFRVFFPAGTYKLSVPIVGVNNVCLKLRGENKTNTIIQWAGTTGYMFSPTGDGGYDIRDFQFVGIVDTPGLYGIGSNTPGAAAGITVLSNLKMYGFDEAVSFGPEFEHSVGLYYEDIYIQNVMRCAINLGGLTGAAASGESNFFFGRVCLTNAGATRTEYSSSKAADTPDTTHDRITWTGAVPTYGFVVMRSADGSTGWHVPPNWVNTVGFNSLTFDALKGVGETWNYKVVPNTIGLNIRRAKAIFAGSLQSEYFGVGQYYNNIHSATIGTIYYETRDQVIPPPMICAVATSDSSSISIGGGYVDSCSYGIITDSNSIVEYKNVEHVNVHWAAIGKFSGATDTNVRYSGLTGVTTYVRSPVNGAYDYNDSGLEYSSSLIEDKIGHVTKAKRTLLFRGVEKSAWSYDSTNGATMNLNSLVLTPFSKSLIVPPSQSTSLTTLGLTSGVAATILSFTVPSNNVLGGQFQYTIGVSSGGVNRQSVSGVVNVAAVSAAGTVAADVSASIAYALQTGTNTTVWSASVSGTTVNLQVSVTTSLGTPNILCYIAPIAFSGNVVPTIVQS